jgi:hypothetical protein
MNERKYFMIHRLSLFCLEIDRKKRNDHYCHVDFMYMKINRSSLQCYIDL